MKNLKFQHCEERGDELSCDAIFCHKKNIGQDSVANVYCWKELRNVDETITLNG